MTDPQFLTTRPDQVHHIQAKLAFLDDPEHRARPALVRSVDGAAVELLELDGTATGVEVHHGDRLAEVLRRDDLTRVRGLPFLLVNEHHRVLAVATGPSAPPSRLRVLVVSRLDDEGGAVELLAADEEQPAWQLFALRA